MSDFDRDALAARLSTFSLSDLEQPVGEALELFDRARSKCPVPHSDRQGGFFMLLNDEDVRSAMMNWQVFSSAPSALRPLAERPEDQFRTPPLDYDPPEQAAWRQFYTRVINANSAAAVKEKLKPELNAIFDRMFERGKGDLVTELANVIPAAAIFLLLGIDDPKGREFVLYHHRVMNAASHDHEKFAAHRKEICNFAWNEAQKRRENPQDDALTELAHMKLDGQLLTEKELGTLVGTMLSAGSGTTGVALASLFHDVLSRPDLRAQLIAEMSLIPAAINESLRLHTPFFGLFRRVTKEVTVQGQTLPENTSVLMCWQAANLDPKAFDDPREFRLNRPGSHLTFGLGTHFCAGARLARAELEVALELLLTRYPDIELANDKPIEPRFIGAGAAGIPSLPVVFPRR